MSQKKNPSWLQFGWKSRNQIRIFRFFRDRIISSFTSKVFSNHSYLFVVVAECLKSLKCSVRDLILKGLCPAWQKCCCECEQPRPAFHISDCPCVNQYFGVCSHFCDTSEAFLRPAEACVFAPQCISAVKHTLLLLTARLKAAPNASFTLHTSSFLPFFFFSPHYPNLFFILLRHKVHLRCSSLL